MHMVGLLQLVFDDDHAVIREIAAKEVQREAADRMLCDFEHEVHSEQVTENVNVLEYPGREVVRLVCPDFSRRDGGEATHKGLSSGSPASA